MLGISLRSENIMALRLLLVKILVFQRASVPSFQLKRFVVGEMHQEMNTGVMLVDL